jgi:hypothetical protein
MFREMPVVVVVLITLLTLCCGGCKDSSTTPVEDTAPVTCEPGILPVPPDGYPLPDEIVYQWSNYTVQYVYYECDWSGCGTCYWGAWFKKYVEFTKDCRTGEWTQHGPWTTYIGACGLNGERRRG